MTLLSFLGGGALQTLSFQSRVRFEENDEEEEKMTNLYAVWMWWTEEDSGGSRMEAGEGGEMIEKRIGRWRQEIWKEM